ncbi:MAG: enoyl-CoA hydratase/isomerase family protein [Candidatus Eremiobacteraeota bacterium]|nr:enoyl-CoA hydratase/isomerase family protein [Candidatus Eremiobacteraeota bacterium]
MSDRSDADVVRFEVRERVVSLTIDRPASRNALDPAAIAQLRAGLARAQATAGVRAIVLGGSGDRAFCAGADLKPASGSFEPDFSATTNDYAELLREGMACTLPLVARVNGHCLAGGMGLLAMCDLAVSVDAALFGLPEVKVGLFPMQVLALLRRLVPVRLLDEMCLSGEPIDAERALRAGLVNYVVPAAELDDKVAWLVGRLIDKSPTAQRRGKYALRTSAGMDFAEALAFLEGQIATLALTEDAREGRLAFGERRAAQWTNR